MTKNLHFIIDAYNLLFWCLKGENLERERELLIDEVNAHVKRRGLDLTLVFDATWTEDPLVQRHFDSIEIFFTDKGVTADDHILHMLETTNPQNKVVVTSDRALARGAVLRGAKTLSTPSFYSWLKKIKAKKGIVREKISFSPPKTFAQEGSLSWYEKVFNKRLQESKDKKVE